MNMHWKILLIVMACTLASPTAFAQWMKSKDDFHDKLLQLGGGPELGSFGLIAETICDTVNQHRRNTSVRCIPLRSAGAEFNARAVETGAVQLGMAQEDLVAEVYKNGESSDGKSLRTVSFLHISPIAIMVRRASGITELAQIRNGVVNKGNKGSGIYVNASAVFKALDLQDKDIRSLVFMPPVEFERAFCAGKVDVIVNNLAHPSELYRRLRACGGEFLDIPPDIMQKMMRTNPWLKPTVIPAGMYDQDQRQVNTLGVRNLLITHVAVDEEAIFRFAKILNEYNKSMKAAQPLLASMTQMRRSDLDKLPAPIHPGALRELKEHRP
jgi:TRAP transporter TAXI family solute receptor